MSTTEPHLYEFDDFRVDAARRVLLRRGEPVSLKPRVFDTLLYLVRNRGRLLEKDELMRAIWPDAFVEENNLNQNVSTLRRALGESRGENRYIVTVPGRGYRFAADVRTVPEVTAELEGPVAVESDALAAPGVSPEPRERPAWRSVVAPLTLLAVAGLGLASLYFGGARTSVSSLPPVRKIAVLPFKPVVLENRDESFEMGMADTLIAKLSNVRDFTVRPLSAVRRYGGLEQDPVAAGQALGVEAVLDGSIQRWGNRVRVTARLVRVGDGKLVWAGQFDEEFTNIFALQDSISAKVVRELALELTGEERALLAKRYTDDANAYELYLKGRLFLSHSRQESITKAVGYFDEAIRKDPNYALAYVGLADCYTRLPITSDVPSREAFPKAKAAALRALEIDGRLAEAHATLGWIKLWYEWDWEGAESEFRRAVDVDPGNPFARLGYAHLLSDLGRHEEALDEVDRALGLDPISPIAGTLKGHFLYHARRYPEAIDQLQRTLELEPNFWVGQITLGKSCERAGRYEEALEAFRKAEEGSGGISELISLSGYAHAAAGRRAEAERALRELEAISGRRYVPPYNLALVHYGLGDSTEAFRWLERAYDERDVHMVFLGMDPKWDALRSDPHFVSLVKRMKLPV
jgi:DNA-binding winged helix-turn-helix (wHTH) protein/TolB-like protein/Flp pilus assembly protein TadD